MEATNAIAKMDLPNKAIGMYHECSIESNLFIRRQGRQNENMAKGANRRKRLQIARSDQSEPRSIGLQDTSMGHFSAIP